MGNSWTYHRNPDAHPYDDSPLEFDPNYGYPEGARKKKEMRFSMAEVESLQIPDELRSYCMHKIIAWKKCQYDNFPFVYHCKHLWHEYGDCENEEAKDRMKDYERERRLLQRRKRILQKQAEMKEKEGLPA